MNKTGQRNSPCQQKYTINLKSRSSDKDDRLVSEKQPNVTCLL